jgi:pimeloyl-ACP methyl ester carboxylesterase
MSNESFNSDLTTNLSPNISYSPDVLTKSMKERLIQVNGINVSYFDSGKESQPILFIHGFPFEKSMWLPQMEQLMLNHRVISYDIRGFGKSTTNDQEPSMSLYADDLIALMDVLKINKAVVCGLSMGGYILLDAVLRYPNRFKAIILADTQCTGDSAEAKEKRKKSIQQINAGGLPEFSTSFVNAIFYKETLTSNRELVKFIADTILATTPSVISGALNALAKREDRCSILDRIDVPTLIICGKEDSVTPVVKSEYMNQKIKGSVLEIIDGAGHLSNLERAEVFNKHVEDFVHSIV